MHKVESSQGYILVENKTKSRAKKMKSCDLCKKEFTRYEKLKKHNKRFHKVKEQHPDKTNFVSFGENYMSVEPVCGLEKEKFPSTRTI